MKRAAVWKGYSGRWWVDVCLAEDWVPDEEITARVCDLALMNPTHPGCDTHAEALAHALAEVGLSTHAEHREPS